MCCLIGRVGSDGLRSGLRPCIDQCGRQRDCQLCGMCVAVMGLGWAVMSAYTPHCISECLRLVGHGLCGLAAGLLLERIRVLQRDAENMACKLHHDDAAM